MSRDMAASLPIGPVQMYWNDVRLGSPKTQATIRYNKDTVQQKDEQTGQQVMSHKTGETCEVDVVIADFRPEQMRYAYDQSTGFATPAVINTVNYTSTASVTFRYREDIKLSGTANATVAQAGFTSGTISVFKSDFSNAPDGYTEDTDFTATAIGGTIARKGSVITDGETVIVEYNNTSNAVKLDAGGERADFEASLRLVNILDSGKMLQFYAHRAKKIGASDVAVQMAAEFGGIAMTFVCLAKLTEAPGKQLFYFAEEI